MPPEDELSPVVDAILAAFPEEDDPAPEDVERIMRPFATIIRATNDAVQRLLSRQGRMMLDMRIGHWIEAEYVLSGDDPDRREHRIDFLNRDRCECVYPYLLMSRKHKAFPVDKRIKNVIRALRRRLSKKNPAS